MEEAPSRGGASGIFDSVLNLESTFIQKGRAEANSDKKSVDLDAYDTGKRYGEEIGYELGFISGVVSVLEERAMVEEHSSTPARQERALRTIHILKQNIRSLPLENPDDPSFTERLNDIRIGYKKARALLGVWQKAEQSSAGSLDF